MIHFWKMNGAGNDFVVLDNRDLHHRFSREQIARLCHRQFGVGADGMLLVEPAQGGDADCRMRYYNSDGGEAEMCGNGARCFARFVNRLHGGDLPRVSFETMAGIINATFPGENIVCVNLSEPFDISFRESLEVDGETLTVHTLNTGVPHAVIVIDDIESVDIQRLGGAIRRHERFAPQGTNVNFIQTLSPGHISVRTYERGVEHETLACGTGMVASAIVHEELANDQSPITVRVRGGDDLSVHFDHPADLSYQNVTLTGPADFVFEGDLPDLAD